MRFAGVPRFYFHVYDDVVALDEEGVDLATFAQVRDAAVLAARELATEEIKRKGTLTVKHRVEVEDEQGRPVLTMPFSAAFRIVDE